MKKDEGNIQTNEFIQAVGPQSQMDLLENCTTEINAESKSCK